MSKGRVEQEAVASGTPGPGSPPGKQAQQGAQGEVAAAPVTAAAAREATRAAIKARVAHVNPGERSYHIFYQATALLRSARPGQKQSGKGAGRGGQGPAWAPLLVQVRRRKVVDKRPQRAAPQVGAKVVQKFLVRTSRSPAPLARRLRTTRAPGSPPGHCREARTTRDGSRA